ncbi:hypothetical protein CRUP_013273 [Coryphaenoides rupestris]|nr:hypothetical protein CRUP_013273 [Coryphaenoides rupestris]
MEEKLTKYFPKEPKPESPKGLPKRSLPLVLFLKVQYYVENGRLICERKARHLYYSDLRERVLRSECRQQEEAYFQLAAYALQADLGDHPPLEEPEPEQEQGAAPRFQPKDYFPPWIVAKRGVGYLLCHGPKAHRELWGMSTRDAILLFIKESCRLEDVPVSFYRLQKEMNNLRQLLYDFPWCNVGRLTFLKRYRESYISDEMDADPQGCGCEGSPRLSRQSTCSSGIEVDARHHGSISMEMTSMDTAASAEGGGAVGRRRAEKCFSSAASHGSSHTSGVDVGGVKARTDEEEEEEEVECPEQELKVSRTEEVHVDDNTNMFHLADLLQGISVDFSQSTPNVDPLDAKACPSNNDKETVQPHNNKDTLAQVLQSRGPVCVDRHSQSLNDVRLFPPPTPLGSTLPPDTSLSCTFGLPDPQANPRSPSSAEPHMSYYPSMHCQAKPSFYGRRAPNCLSLDLLGEEQLLEFIL